MRTFRRRPGRPGDEADPQNFVALHCAKADAAELANWLLAQGAERVSVAALEQVFDARNPLFERLEGRIGHDEGMPVAWRVVAFGDDR